MEDRSKQMLDAALPGYWVPRSLDKVDYGIDSFVEIGHRIKSEKGDRVDAQMKGEVVFVQLKAHLKSIPWKADGTFTYSGIAWSTALYWLSIEVPVFFVVADLDASILYFANAKSQVRFKYADRLTYDSLSLELDSKNILSPLTAEKEFYTAYLLEREHRTFALRLVDLVLNQDKYYDYLLGGLSRDYSGVLDPEEEVTLFHLIRLIMETCTHLGLPTPPLEIEAWLEENGKLDEKLCKDESIYEVFRMRVCQWLLPWLFLCVPHAVDRILKQEAA